MRPHLASSLAIFAGAAAIGACGGPDGRPADWPYLHAAIVTPGCVRSGCHGPVAPPGGLAFDDAARAHQALMDGQYVRPGDPNSPLLYLLEGRERALMPPDGTLPRADIELIRRWIEEGAAP